MSVARVTGALAVVVSFLAASACRSLPTAPANTRTKDVEALYVARDRTVANMMLEVADCELTLQLLAHPPIGKEAMENRRAFATVETCIKRAGSGIVIPTRWELLYAQNQGGQGDWRLCGDQPSTAALDGADGEVYTCVWDRGFRDGFPMDIRLRNVAGGPVAEHIGAARVFLNGALVGRMPEAELAKATATLDGTTLTRRQMPYDAPMALRLLPRGMDLPDAPEPKAAKGPLQKMKQAIGEVVAKAASDALPSLGCAAELIDGWLDLVSAVVDRPLAISLPSAWTCPADTAPGDKVVPVAKQLKDWAAAIHKARQDPGAVPAALKALADKIATAGRDATSLTDLVQKLAAELAQQTNPVPAVDKLVAALQALAEAMKDDIANVPSWLAEQVKNLRTSAATQEKLYRALVEAVQRDVQPARTENPAPLDGESSLNMHYRDYHQSYYLLAWSGVPIAVEGDVVADAPDYSSFIPFLDFAGFREQWEVGSLGSFSAGFGVAGFSEKSAADQQTYFRLGFQGNVGIGPFRLGASWLVSSTWQDDLKGSKQWRVLLGADLVKVFTGALGALGVVDADAGNEDSQ